MAEDKTPTVTARRRKPTRHMRLRLETVKRLRALGAQKKTAREKDKERAEKVTVTDPNTAEEKSTESTTKQQDTDASTVKTRPPKIKKAALAKPAVPKAKFRKRQVHKAWLPTHLYHAKRAHMTPPSAPLWRFAVPLTPTQKSYRPTHRASSERGAIAWDTSYMSTIGVEGQQRSIEGMLKALGVDTRGGDVRGAKGEKWRHGTRVLETFVYEREAPHELIGPVTIIWCVLSTDRETGAEPEKRKRRLFLRVHPSAFFQLWEEVVGLAKVAKPSVNVEDLRFEIGSIEITGPGSTEALLGALWPSLPEGSKLYDEESIEHTWTHLAGVTNPAMLPNSALLAFDIQDPRLHHPPRTIALPKTVEEQNKLLELLAGWPVDQSQATPALFERTARTKASKLASQKAINRRRSLSTPGSYPDALPTDPHIPIVLYVSSASANKRQQGTWTLLAPWKTIQPIWYSLMYYPLSTGQQPRFGGLREKQQLTFEAGRPWFPADFPGTRAGWEWEVQERRKRWEEWQRRPKGKRVSWEKVDLGRGVKGECGEGWACDWKFLLEGSGTEGQDAMMGGTVEAERAGEEEPVAEENDAKTVALQPPSRPEKLKQLSATHARDLLRQPSAANPTHATDLEGKLITVRLTLLTRGVPQTCARIYRLPSASTGPDLRKAWLALSQKQKQHGPKNGLPKLPTDAPAHLVQRRLAQSLLEPPRAGEDAYPACPGVEDLVGFVTTGNFNLAEGLGTGIGSLLVERVMEGGEQGRLCMVRNAGMDVGRLARWEIV